MGEKFIGLNAVETGRKSANGDLLHFKLAEILDDQHRRPIYKLSMGESAGNTNGLDLGNSRTKLLALHTNQTVFASPTFAQKTSKFSLDQLTHSSTAKEIAIAGALVVGAVVAAKLHFSAKAESALVKAAEEGGILVKERGTVLAEEVIEKESMSGWNSRLTRATRKAFGVGKNESSLSNSYLGRLEPLEMPGRSINREPLRIRSIKEGISPPVGKRPAFHKIEFEQPAAPHLSMRVPKPLVREAEAPLLSRTTKTEIRTSGKIAELSPAREPLFDIHNAPTGTHPSAKLLETPINEPTPSTVRFIDGKHSLPPVKEPLVKRVESDVPIKIEPQLPGSGKSLSHPTVEGLEPRLQAEKSVVGHPIEAEKPHVGENLPTKARTAPPGESAKSETTTLRLNNEHPGSGQQSPAAGSERTPGTIGKPHQEVSISKDMTEPGSGEHLVNRGEPGAASARKEIHTSAEGLPKSLQSEAPNKAPSPNKLPETGENVQITAGAQTHESAPPASRGVVNSESAPPASRGVVNSESAPPASRGVVNSESAPPASRGVVNSESAPPASRGAVNSESAPSASRGVVNSEGTPPASRGVVNSESAPPASRGVVNSEGTPQLVGKTAHIGGTANEQLNFVVESKDLKDPAGVRLNVNTNAESDAQALARNSRSSTTSGDAHLTTSAGFAGNAQPELQIFHANSMNPHEAPDLHANVVNHIEPANLQAGNFTVSNAATRDVVNFTLSDASTSRTVHLNLSGNASSSPVDAENLLYPSLNGRASSNLARQSRRRSFGKLVTVAGVAALPAAAAVVPEPVQREDKKDSLPLGNQTKGEDARLFKAADKPTINANVEIGKNSGSEKIHEPGITAPVIFTASNGVVDRGQKIIPVGTGEPASQTNSNLLFKGVAYAPDQAATADHANMRAANQNAPYVNEQRQLQAENKQNPVGFTKFNVTPSEELIPAVVINRFSQINSLNRSVTELNSKIAAVAVTVTFSFTDKQPVQESFLRKSNENPGAFSITSGTALIPAPGAENKTSIPVQAQQRTDMANITATVFGAQHFPASGAIPGTSATEVKLAETKVTEAKLNQGRAGGSPSLPGSVANLPGNAANVFDHSGNLKITYAVAANFVSSPDSIKEQKGKENSNKELETLLPKTAASESMRVTNYAPSSSGPGGSSNIFADRITTDQATQILQRYGVAAYTAYETMTSQLWRINGHAGFWISSPKASAPAAASDAAQTTASINTPVRYVSSTPDVARPAYAQAFVPRAFDNLKARGGNFAITSQTAVSLDAGRNLPVGISTAVGNASRYQNTSASRETAHFVNVIRKHDSTNNLVASAARSATNNLQSAALHQDPQLSPGQPAPSVTPSDPDNSNAPSQSLAAVPPSTNI